MDGHHDLPGDPWSRWLNVTRNGHDTSLAEALSRDVDHYITHLLAAGKPRPGETLLDIGTGDGAVAFAAIADAGPGLRAILTDISNHLLRQARERATALNCLAQCQFIQCPAARLAVADASMDIVTSRAALVYEHDKPEAFREMFRVLKPGGRLAIAEPIFQDDAFAATALSLVLAARPAGHPDRFLPLLQRWKAAQFPSSEAAIAATPITNFNERDLFRFAAKAGFSEIHLQLHIDMTATSAKLPWEVFTATSPHPLAPSLAEIFDEQFTPQERDMFEAVLRPVVETGRIARTNRLAYLNAMKTAA